MTVTPSPPSRSRVGVGGGEVVSIVLEADRGDTGVLITGRDLIDLQVRELTVGLRRVGGAEVWGDRKTAVAAHVEGVVGAVELVERQRVEIGVEMRPGGRGHRPGRSGVVRHEVAAPPAQRDTARVS